HSIEQYLRTVRILFDWFEDQSLLFLNPARALVIAKPPRRVRWTLSDSQVRTILALPDPSSPGGLRDRALVEVAYASAVRRQELTAMSMYDIDLQQAAVRVLGKGRKERMLPLGRNGVKYLENYLKHGRPKLLKDNIDCPALWISRRTRRGLTDDGIARIIKKLGRHAALPHTLTCHVFRRTCATEMLRNGAHPEMVRMLLGHSSLKNLAQYLCINIADIRRMHRRSNPGK
ncbi:MAG: tyrosine-type recombinase/integrase, partial [Lentisphaeria bacterium]|nr:tyrosine-type recombinase/integrase [Lentisphaeria bacterium]